MPDSSGRVKGAAYPRIPWETEADRRRKMRELCEVCEQHPAAQHPHPCPYLWELNDDRVTLCYCCPDCEDRCADDI